MVRMTTTRWVLHAELVREELDEETLAEKRAERPALPPEELTPAIWTVSWGMSENKDLWYAEDGKDHEVAALVSLVLAHARLPIGKITVSWTLSGTPPQGRTLAETVADLGVTLHEQWPAAWR